MNAVEVYTVGALGWFAGALLLGWLIQEAFK